MPGLAARWGILDVLAMWLPTAGTAVLLSIVARALILRIQQLATHDELTAALNRGGLQADAAMYLEKASRSPRQN